MSSSPARRSLRRPVLIWIIGLVAGIAVGGVAAYGLTTVVAEAVIVAH